METYLRIHCCKFMINKTKTWCLIINANLIVSDKAIYFARTCTIFSLHKFPAASPKCWYRTVIVIVRPIFHFEWPSRIGQYVLYLKFCALYNVHHQTFNINEMCGSGNVGPITWFNPLKSGLQSRALCGIVWASSVAIVVC